MILGGEWRAGRFWRGGEEGCSYDGAVFAPVLCFLVASRVVCCAAQPELLTQESPQALAVVSPDGRLEVTVTLADGQLRYRVDRDGKPVVARSRLGLVLDGAPEEDSWRLVELRRREIEQRWSPVWGKRAVVLDHASELVLELAASRDGRAMEVVLRAYDGGVAVRYSLPGSAGVEELELSGERTEFRLASEGEAWSYNGEHRPLGPEALGGFAGVRRPPVLVRAEGGALLAIHEAALGGLAPMTLSAGEGALGFQVGLPPAEVQLPFETPWRVLLVGDHPGDLVDSDLLVNLNPPCPIEDTSWIRPGVTFWDWRAWGHQVGDFRYGLDLPSWKRFVDLAAEAGVPYLLLDADWYGPEFDESSDPVKGGKARDVREIIRYGRERGVGVFLYLNDAASRGNELNAVLRQYSEWGAAGIKYGFMQARGRERVEKTRRIIETCARYRLMCNFHDGPVPPTGDERTWPNCLTREFCHSQSDAHRVFTPSTFCLQVYVNMLAGPIDMCNGLFEMTDSLEQRPKIFSQLDSTITAEAARTLIVYSGLTVLADSADSYRKHPELLAFLAAQRGPWRESRTLAGEIGQSIVMMRQTDDAYLIGACTNEQAREIELPLDFLPTGAFEAVIIEDTASTHYQHDRESYHVRRRRVTAADTLDLTLAPGGGACVRISRF